MARLPDLRHFRAKNTASRSSAIQDVIAHRMEREKLVEEVAKTRFPRIRADGQASSSCTLSAACIDGTEHLALVKGDPLKNPALVRVHSECLTGDALGSLRCDCGAQLQAALRQIAESGNGVLVYMRRHEGRGIGLGEQDPRLRASGSGHGHGRSQPPPGLPSRSPPLRHGRADPALARRHASSAFSRTIRRRSSASGATA